MNRSRKEVLIVDNDEDVLVQVENALESDGYETTTAWSGQQALELLTQKAFDLVVLDDQLSDTTAEEVLKKLRTASRSIPVIVTQNPGAAPCTADYYLSMGACAVVRKRPACEIQALVDKALPVVCLGTR